MLRIKVNFSTYYVGSGKDLLRLWKRALKHGYKNGYKGYEESIPKYNPAGTYCIYFLPRVGKMYWNNFTAITNVGHYANKDIPDYRQYKGNMKLAKCIYEMNKNF